MTNAEQDDKDVLAAEYVLGTLDADDRENVRMLLGIDPSFAARVRQWEERLGQLHAIVQPVEPPADGWQAIKAGIAEFAPNGQFWLPAMERASAAATASGGTSQPQAADEASPSRPLGAAAEGAAAEIVVLSARARRWRSAAAGIGAIAATLVAIVVVRELRPDVMPPALRPAERVVERVVEKPVEVVRTVEVPSPRMAEFVAVLQKDANSPAFLLTVDVDKHSFSMRRVGAEKQADKSYELWLVSAEYPAPRSLGLVGDEEFTVRPALADYDVPTLNAATYAVSLEPQGGSPSGTPSGPVLFSGKLLQTTPSALPKTTP